MMHEETGLKVDPHPLHEPLLNILIDRITYCIKALVAYIYLSIITTQFPGTTSSNFMMVFMNLHLPYYLHFIKKQITLLDCRKLMCQFIKAPPATRVFLSVVDTCKGMGQQIIKELD